MIELRPLAQTDLSLRFARQMGANKIRHYVLSGLDAVQGNILGKTPTEIVGEFIEKTEGEKVVFLAPAVSGRNDGGPLNIVPATVILDDHPKIKKALRKNKSHYTLYQFNEMPSLGARILGFLVKPINAIIGKINTLRLKASGVFKIEDRMEYLDRLSEIRLLPLINIGNPVRRVEPCTFLSVTFAAPDCERASQALLDDLKLLDDNDLILGHLTMPSMMLMADQTGSGVNTFTLFCFLFLDSKKIAKLLGIPYSEYIMGPKSACRVPGVKYAGYEGMTNYLDGVDPASKYEIETVQVPFGLTHDELLHSHSESYKESVRAVNEAARAAAELYRDSIVRNKRSENIANNTVEVKADIITKNSAATLAEIYKRNRG
jgi:hypothetical protein